MSASGCAAQTAEHSAKRTSDAARSRLTDTQYIAAGRGVKFFPRAARRDVRKLSAAAHPKIHESLSIFSYGGRAAPRETGQKVGRPARNMNCHSASDSAHGIQSRTLRPAARTGAAHLPQGPASFPRRPGHQPAVRDGRTPREGAASAARQLSRGLIRVIKTFSFACGFNKTKMHVRRYQRVFIQPSTLTTARRNG